MPKDKLWFRRMTPTEADFDVMKNHKLIKLCAF